ncbi:hypothetical protein F5J12DRAFT_892764 [Pisolithus orientalis]|uniref:uncharacterized protein n=1 Tax=Pisolithus orientalis TaxID=936130 RepID=UPI002224501A|nr:uncharacterized protein F5J12DRAFT_892764 [Pisolithus orientalis]KAI6006581.1 hypothetical protein F5J12DRAFT_892764 [Pisolithus orientalis]
MSVKDCLPLLDCGNAFDTLKLTFLLPELDKEEVLSSTGFEMPARSGGKVTPLSLRYSGHRFGVWTSQLVITPDPSGLDATYEVQLKGARPSTEALMASSIREYLCSRAMHALGVLTTRSLALVYLYEVRVLGNFEALSPPSRAMVFFGGEQQYANYEALRIFGEWTVNRILERDGVNLNASDAWGKGWSLK